jgi:hypothetical protein
MSEWTATPQFEEQIRQSFGVPEIRAEFVDQVHAELMRRAAAKARKSRPWLGLRPAWTVALTILIILILITLVLGPQRVYAAVRQLLGLGDPGLQSVQDAGLVTDLNITAQPTLLATATPLHTPQPASAVGESQTLEGITLTLNWVYLDEDRLALGLQFTPLPADVTLDAPQVTFVGVVPRQLQGYSQSLRSAENQTVYVSYQVIQAEAVGGKVDLSIAVPLVRLVENQPVTLANFRFELKDIPVFSGQRLAIQQTSSVKRNGVEVRLKSVRVMPSNTEVVACYDFPTSAPFWYMQQATVQIGNGPEESYRPYRYLSDVKDDHCVKLGFATGNAGGETRLVFRVRRLVVPLTMQAALPTERIAAANRELAAYGIEIKSAPLDQSEGPGGWQFVRQPPAGTGPAQDPRLLVQQALEEKVEGPWEFSVDIPSRQIIPGQATATPAPTPAPAPLGKQTVDQVTMTLDWIFADAKRVAFGYTLSGLPDIPQAMNLSGDVIVKDAQGKPIGGAGGGSSSIQWVAGKPGTVTGTWGNVMLAPLNQSEATFSIDLTLDGSKGFDWNHSIGSFERSPDATPFPPGVFPPTLPDRFVGTFHFEVRTQVYPLKVLEPKQPVTVNGITLRLERAEITPSYAQFTLCYVKPSSRDWMIGRTVNLKAGAYEAHINGYDLLADADYGGAMKKSSKSLPTPQLAKGERCVQIDFLLGHSNSAQPLTLTISTLEQSIPESIPDAELKVAREKLKAQGIELDYTTFSATGGGGGGPLFPKKPEGMTDAEAYQKFMAALGYVYPGPWVFNLEIQ